MEIAGGEHIKVHSLVSLKQAKKKKGRREKDKKTVLLRENMHATATEENVENTILSIILKK